MSMDPSIVKILEEDEDETMHSGADVDAFTAALNRDLVGYKSKSKAFNSDSVHLFQGSNYSSNPSVSYCRNSSQNDLTKRQIQQDMNILQNPPIIQSQSIQNQVTYNPENLHRTNNEQKMPTGNPENASKNSKLSFGQLISVIIPQLDKDKGMQLQSLYNKLRRNEVSKEGFLRLIKEMVPNQMIKKTLDKLQTQAARISQAGSSNAMAEINGQGYQNIETESDFHGKCVNQINTKQERENSLFPPIEGLSKQQDIHFSQGFFPIYGNNNRSLSGSNVSSLDAMSSIKQQAFDTHMREEMGHQSVSGAQLGISNQRNNLTPSSMSTIHSNPMPRSITAQLNLQIPHGVSSEGPGNDSKKTFISQKKPFESLVPSPAQPSKKQKVSDSLADQSIEQLNDVTAASGVNLREEEDQMFSGSKEACRISEASQRAVKEEEERLILQKIPLRNNLAEIMSQCGVKNMDGDVERCLSLSVEERLRVLISNLIRLSKQRVDIEKLSHRTLVTSDIRKQIMDLNQKAREEWDNKQSEAEKLQKANEAEDIDGLDRGDKVKEDGRAKSLKQTHVNKEDDDKMHASAANVAARAAVGGDDMLSKWQIMAEQARQKREGLSDFSFISQQGKYISFKSSSSLSKASHKIQEIQRSQQNASAILGSSRESVRSQITSKTKVARSICVKDVIAVLESEPQMSKSDLLFCLYEKSNADIIA